MPLLFLSVSVSFLYYFFSVVCSAVAAYAVIEIILAAFRTFCHCGSSKFAVLRASLISASRRNLFLWYCHFNTSKIALLAQYIFLFVFFFHFFKDFFERKKSRIDLTSLTTAFSMIKIFTAFRTQSETVLTTENFVRKFKFKEFNQLIVDAKKSVLNNYVIVTFVFVKSVDNR